MWVDNDALPDNFGGHINQEVSPFSLAHGRLCIEPCAPKGQHTPERRQKPTISSFQSRDHLGAFEQDNFVFLTLDLKAVLDR